MGIVGIKKGGKGMEIAGIVMCSISLLFAALKEDNWDVITFQQSSGITGQPETYRPYLENLAKEIRKLCPGGDLYIHQTWAFETDSDNPLFINYHHDQRKKVWIKKY